MAIMLINVAIYWSVVSIIKNIFNRISIYSEIQDFYAHYFAEFLRHYFSGADGEFILKM